MEKIRLENGEVLACNIISTKIQEVQNILAQAQEASKAMIGLLEIKYNATYDPATGHFNTKEPVEEN